jgi:hypothetical protein
MKRRLKASGYGLKCNDDNADYPGRMERLRQQQSFFAVATVDSYVLNGSDKKYPAVIVAVLDESKGGDGLVAGKTIRSIDDLKKKSAARIAFTPGSPSEHLVKSIASHFDAPFLLAKENRIEKKVGRSSEKLLTDAADVAVLWEPDITKAVSKGYLKLISTENTEKLIVDILLVNREFNGSRDRAGIAFRIFQSAEALHRKSRAVEKGSGKSLQCHLRPGRIYAQGCSMDQS